MFKKAGEEQDKYNLEELKVFDPGELERKKARMGQQGIQKGSYGAKLNADLKQGAKSLFNSVKGIFKN